MASASNFGRVRAAEMDSSKVSADVTCEFLEVAFHSILYVRQLYPREVFQRRRKYNVPVQVACHPGVNQYIRQLLGSIKRQLQEGKIEKISFVIFDQLHVLEKFVFEVQVNKGITLTESDDAYLLKVEQGFRAFLLKLNVSDAYLDPVPEGCSWVVQVETIESTIVDLQKGETVQDFKWIEADHKQVLIENPNIVPLKSMSAPLMQMQLFVEESLDAKEKTSWQDTSLDIVL